MIFRQLFESSTSTYTYLLADEASREAVIIDPVDICAARDEQLLREMELRLVAILDTHVHADHVTGAALLHDRTNATICASHRARLEGEHRALRDGDEIQFGALSLTTLETPGHTACCLSFAMAGRIFTGDTLLIRGCGRTDFQGGSAAELYRSVKQKIFTLPDATVIFPGHDYRGLTCSTVGEEKRHNPRLGGERDEASFVNLMENLKLSPPARIDIAVPANRRCGREI